MLKSRKESLKSQKKIDDMEKEIAQLNARMLRAGDGQITEATIATRRRYLRNFGSKIF
jgi:hypothetical protein